MGSGANEGAFLISRRANPEAAVRLALIALLLAAWGLLLYRLDEIPPGFQHDQMFNTMDALDILQGHYRIYFPANFGREPLGMYLPAGVFTMVGDHFVWGLRFSTVMCGLLSVALTAALARRHLPAAAAWLAAALMTGSFWFLFAARLGLEPMVLLPLTTAMCYFLSRGMARSSVRDLALAGIAGGAGLYAYPAGRPLILMPLLLVLHRLVVAALERKRAATRPAATLTSGPVLRGLFLAALLMALIGAPLFVYIQTYPAVADARLGELQGPILAALRGDVAPLLGTIREGVLSILWAGPDALPYHYNIPGRPALQPILACFFLLGLTLVSLGWRRPDEFVLLLGLLLGLLAVLLTGADALYVRGIVALPLLFILAARGAWWAVTRLARLLDRVAQRWPRAAWAASAGRWLIPIALGVLLLWHVAESSRAYFVTWAQAEPTQRIYNADFRAAVALADALPPEEEVYIGSDRNLDLDRRTYQLYGPRRSDVQWFYLPGSPPLPRGSFGGATYLLPQTSAELPPALDVLALAAGEQSVTPARAGQYVLLRVLHLDNASIQETLDSAGVRPLDAPVTYGDVLRLEASGARSLSAPAQSAGLQYGSRIELLTRWTALGPWPYAAQPGQAPAPPKLSASLTDATGYRWAQVDVASALPFRTWRPGDPLLERTFITAPVDMPPGRYDVRLSIYDDRAGPLAIRRGDALIAAPPPVASAEVGPGAVSSEFPRPPFPVEEELRAAGAALRPVGRWEALESVLAGVPADLHVSWQASGGRDVPTADLSFRARAVSTDGTLLWEQAADPIVPLPANWPAGQVYRLTHRLLPRTAAPGATPADLKVCAVRGEVVESCAVVGRLSVINRPPLRTLPVPPQVTSGANWSEQLILDGYDVQQSGDTIALTLYWLVPPISPPPVALKRFVHASDATGQILAQVDSTPDNGGIPMPWWRPGEYVVDTVRLSVPAGRQVAQLLVGWYDAATGKRTPVRSATGELLVDDRLAIAIR